MIVEDNKEMNDYLASIFSEKYDIIRAYNGAEACKKIAKQLPNLIISDLMMPVMDGLEATRRIRKGENPLGKTIPILAMTANAFVEDRQAAKEAGMNVHIAKPINAELLKKKIAEYCR